MHRRAARILIALLALSLPAMAADAPPRAFIEHTHVIAPQTIGAFRLVENHYDPAQRRSGVRLRYAWIPNPGIAVDVFVYPAGRAPQADAVAQGMQGFRQDLENAAASGLYRNMQIGEAQPFPLDAEPPAAAAQPSANEDLEARVTRAIAEQATVGMRIAISAQTGEGALDLHSRGYLFHRQLNFFKVRVSVPARAMPADEFDGIADHAARTLVAGIEALNIGACGNKTIEIDSQARGDEAAIALVRATGRILTENCALSEVDGKLAQKARDTHVTRFDFEPGEWSASP
ncbi:hypothetical protein [Luteimonas sp. e5]